MQSFLSAFFSCSSIGMIRSEGPFLEWRRAFFVHKLHAVCPSYRNSLRRTWNILEIAVSRYVHKYYIAMTVSMSPSIEHSSLQIGTSFHVIVPVD